MIGVQADGPVPGGGRAAPADGAADGGGDLGQVADEGQPDVRRVRGRRLAGGQGRGGPDLGHGGSCGLLQPGPECCLLLPPADPPGHVGGDVGQQVSQGKDLYLAGLGAWDLPADRVATHDLGRPVPPVGHSLPVSHLSPSVLSTRTRVARSRNEPATRSGRRPSKTMT